MNSLATAIRDFSISRNIDTMSVVEMGSPYTKYLHRPVETTASLTLMFGDDIGDNYSSLNKLERVFRHDCGFKHRFLGDGAVCQNCGTVYIIGVLGCSQCGSKDIQYESACQESQGTNAMMTNYSIDAGIYDFVVAHVELIYIEPFVVPSNLNYSNWREFALYSLFGGVTEWLCMRCGLFVDKDRITCPGCGGNKLSEREISALRRSCIYCGEEVLGGFACPRCNGRLRPEYAYSN